LLGLTMLGLIYGLIDGSSSGWTTIPILCLAAGALAFVLFALRQRFAANPLILPSLLTNRGFTSVLLLGLAYFAAVDRFSYVVSLFFQLNLGLTAMQAAFGFSPLVAGKTDGGYADLLYTPLTEDSDRAIIDAVGTIAEARGVARAQIALAWLRTKPVVTAPLVGANHTSQIDDAIASLEIDLTSDEIAQLERPYTARYDYQGISDEAEMQKIREQIPGNANS
jgi:hypothetical protein